MSQKKIIYYNKLYDKIFSVINSTENNLHKKPVCETFRKINKPIKSYL